MKVWWNKLSQREQVTVGVGAFVVGILLFYSVLINPLLSKKQDLKEFVTKEAQLLEWMKMQATQITMLQKKLPKVSSTGDKSLLSLLEISLKRGRLSSSHPDIKQLSSDRVQVTFESVIFNDLHTWLSSIWKSNIIYVNEITITPTETPGLVKADVTLKL